MTLDDLPVSESAMVTAIGGSRALRLRLMEMGLVRGTRIDKLRVAPLGDPVELRVRSGRLSVRRHEARAIEVAQ
ncbi:MAG: Fe2+ transport system protein FeoA [Myxococcota bacterium]|jgi:Fe2+ transport system protein FeoA